MRSLLVAIAFAVIAAAGLLGGYLLWGQRAQEAARAQRQLEATTTDLAAVRAAKQELEQRLQEVNKEQQRLAQENEILRKQSTIQQLLGGQPGELPALPPK